MTSDKELHRSGENMPNRTKSLQQVAKIVIPLANLTMDTVTPQTPSQSADSHLSLTVAVA
jgi:hypothetical protein